jgi:hypothetical protein
MLVLGVGKNMLPSMKFWAIQSGFLDSSESLIPTPLALRIFGDLGRTRGLDPFGEHRATPWIVHWNLASDSSKLTAIWFLFNKINQQSISREDFALRLFDFAKDSGEKVTFNTIKRDVEVCFRSYTPSMSGRGKDSNEESAEPLLGDLGVIKSTSRDEVDLSRAKRPTLPTPLFFWAVLNMWEELDKKSPSNTLDWFQIAHAIGSPGKIFRLTEQDLNQRLEEANRCTDGMLDWVDQLGVKNLIRRTNNPRALEQLKEQLLQKSYEE